MDINFNNLRKQTCLAYDRLATALNMGLNNYENNYGDRSYVLAYVEDIQTEMEELKQLIGTIAMCYNDKDPDVINVYEDLYTDDKFMVDFNPENQN